MFMSFTARMDAEIGVVANQLAAAVELTMNPNASQTERLDAYNACEMFKEKSPLCVQCGLYLAQRADYSHFVRHFGLQLMEHCIKYRWYNMSQGEKLFIKVSQIIIIGRLLVYYRNFNLISLFCCRKML